VLAAAAQGGDDKALQTASWVAKNATQYNYTAHWDEFEKQHDACKKNPSGSGCSTVLKVAGVSSESLGNVVLNKDANGTIVSYTLLGDAGAPWMVMEPAEYKMYIASPQQIQEGYKTAPQWQLNLSSALLYAHHGDTEKAVENYAFMLRDPGYQQEMLLGLAMGGLGRLALGPKTAVASTGPKVPPKLQAFTNPPQGPVIPSGWISRPGRAPGSTIYYPPGTDPSAPGSTYIRLMPSGSTPVPGLENGYWISVKNGQPINPATGGTGTRGDTHVPLPPNTVPPKR
jgi:hypothetical protein